MLAWHDVETGRERDYQHWHTQEHMDERVFLPGFLVGRRYSVVGDGPAFLVVYEVESMAATATPRPTWIG